MLCRYGKPLPRSRGKEERGAKRKQRLERRMAEAETTIDDTRKLWRRTLPSRAESPPKSLRCAIRAAWARISRPCRAHRRSRTAKNRNADLAALTELKMPLLMMFGRETARRRPNAPSC
jgi:hypothetical protein